MEKVVLLTGSPSEFTRLNGIRDYVEGYLQRGGLQPDVINIRELPAADLIQARFGGREISEALRKVEAAETVIILTPVYKASFSGLLKIFLDFLPQNGLAGKKILPLAMGGTFGHLLALDYALKPVLAALGATSIEKGAFILDSQVEKTAKHQYRLDEQAKSRLDSSLKFLLPVYTNGGISVTSS
ncbi:FMN reductase [Weizmannia acidilactici]|uniref:FMN reductase n=1 Tax=Weizmannia acidilactici TaxID=2607726 RepID=A0A5J4JII5_9BACI|nr:NADPH-dependent FMN reductase [Weizmannia acidilactici]GER67735.1 FMN reductase [Weizmannia acidilactici]GER71541.1 FMN reductase [Weizmannia acidilactici]GER73613.1 FMN reductase [Weizmannia acidilactici]